MFFDELFKLAHLVIGLLILKPLILTFLNRKSNPAIYVCFVFMLIGLPLYVVLSIRYNYIPNFIWGSARYDNLLWFFFEFLKISCLVILCNCFTSLYLNVGKRKISNGKVKNSKISSSKASDRWIRTFLNR